jgi:hypothetical protein
MRFTIRQLLSATLFVAVVATCWTNMPPWRERSQTPVWLWFLAWAALGAAFGNIWGHPVAWLVVGLILAVLLGEVPAVRECY